MSDGVTRLRLRVSPGAGQEEVVGRHGDGWKLRVRQAPERGLANDAVIELLARVLRVPRTSLRLVSGHASREKIVELEGVDLHEADRRLASPTGKE